MDWIKKISKILAGLFVIVSLTISFNYNRTYEAAQIISDTELLITNESTVINEISFLAAQKLISLLNQTKGNLHILNWNNRVLKNNASNFLRFKIQNQTSLEFKSFLLNILINDIIQQKSH